jgi:D-alanyl-lipoteichoic acid acyltransferase DltB (MBOAT superfamily)
VVWAALHAVFLLIYMVVRGRSASEEETAGPVARLLSTLLTFTAVTFAWIFFRAGSLHDAFDVVAASSDGTTVADSWRW